MNRHERIFLFAFLILIVLINLKLLGINENNARQAGQLVYTSQEQQKSLADIEQQVAAVSAKTKEKVVYKCNPGLQEKLLKAAYLIEAATRGSKNKKFDAATKQLKAAKKIIWAAGDKNKQHKKALHGLMQPIDAMSQRIKAKKAIEKSDDVNRKLDTIIGDVK